MLYSFKLDDTTSTKSVMLEMLHTVCNLKTPKFLSSVRIISAKWGQFKLRLFSTQHTVNRKCRLCWFKRTSSYHDCKIEGWWFNTHHHNYQESDIFCGFSICVENIARNWTCIKKKMKSSKWWPFKVCQTLKYFNKLKLRFYLRLMLWNQISK